MKKILIVNANYYKDMTDKLVASALKVLRKKKYKINIINVPGIFEIPIAIRRSIDKFDGFIALGCVIKGDTPHFDLIRNSAFKTILDLSVTYNKPISNGIITALNKKQAKERCGKISSRKPNKGLEAAAAVLSILNDEPKKS